MAPQDDAAAAASRPHGCSLAMQTPEALVEETSAAASGEKYVRNPLAAEGAAEGARATYGSQGEGAWREQRRWARTHAGPRQAARASSLRRA